MRGLRGLDLDDIRKMMAERLKGSMSSTTAAISGLEPAVRRHFGHSGYSPKGIRVGGPGKNRSALQVAEQRNYAISATMRLSRSGSSRWRSKSCVFICREDGPKTELNVEKTIEKTVTKATSGARHGAP